VLPNLSQNVSVPRSFSTIHCHDPTHSPSTAQELEYREPQTWAEVLGEHYTGNKREEVQELEARILRRPFIGAGISATKSAPKSRGLLDDIINNAALLTREPEPRTWAEVLGDHHINTKREEVQELEARILPFIGARISATKSAPQTRGLLKDIIKSTVFNRLLTRDPEPYVKAPVISIGRPDFYQSRDLADDLGTFDINDLMDLPQ